MSNYREWECDNCQAKSGTPLLCQHCQKVRDLALRHDRLIEKAKAYLDLESANNRLALQNELENEDE